jgi:CubicO group peptidase (beta-lactamase class C family)
MRRSASISFALGFGDATCVQDASSTDVREIGPLQTQAVWLATDESRTAARFQTGCMALHAHPGGMTMTFDGSKIDEMLTRAVDDGTVHGVVATVLDRDGVLYEGAAGVATADTIFRNASMTKAVATTGALQLVQQGKLSLDASVASILPEFGELQVLDGFDGDRPILRPPATEATIRQLMTHTAGLGYFFANERLLRYHELTGLPNALSGIKASLSAPLSRDPGTEWEYGVSVDWLGLVVEKLTGQSLSAYLREHVYEPLGMVDSTFALTVAQRARLMPAMARTEDGGLEPTPIDLPPNPEWDAGGHGSYGTARDYGRFVRAWLRGGELDGARILAQETVEMAMANQIEGIPMPDVIRTSDPALSNDIPSLPVPQGWGFGFHTVGVDLPGMRSAGTSDWAGIMNTYYWIDRAAGVGGVFMTQVLPFFDGRIVETVLGFETAVYAVLGAAAPA